MDFLNHATQGFIIGYLPCNSLTIGIISGLIAGIPDLGGEVMAHIFKDDYKFYDSCHFGKINKYMIWLPMWGLHTLQDRFLHTVGYRWWVLKEGGWYEILSWIINLIILYYIWIT